MQLRLNPFYDVIDEEKSFLILDHWTPRHIRIKRTPALAYILGNIHQEITKQKLMDAGQKKYGFAAALLVAWINKLIEHKIIDQCDSDRFSITKEEQHRFQYQIDWLSGFETDKLSRYDFFKKLRNAKICIIGLGGVGSNLAILFASVGVGELSLVDPDVVSKSNLTRQVFYNEQQENTPKAIALRDYIKAFSPFTRVTTIQKKLYKKEDLCRVFSGAALVCQTADTPAIVINRNVNSVCIEKKIPCLFVQASHIGPFYIPGKSACYFCLEHFANKESSHTHDLIAKHLSTRPSRMYPSFVGGPWRDAYFMFIEGFNHITGIKEPKLTHQLLDRSNAYESTFIPLERPRNCQCQREQ